MPTFGTMATRLSRRAVLALTAVPLAALTTASRADGISGGRYVCTTPDCAPYIYDPAIGNPSQGVPPGTPFSALPDMWRCPSCGSAHDAFVRIG